MSYRSGESADELGQDIVVIGGSAGALPAVQKFLRRLPVGFPAAVFIVIHTSPDSPGVLPSILAKATPLPVANATDGALIRVSQVYVAPPDRHLLVKRGHIRVTRGPRENRFRPAVDPLFRTAALAYGSRVIGIILSGGQDDGVLGLSYIKRSGGTTIAQDPNEAESPSMPESAIRQLEIDHVLRADDMAAVVSGLVGPGVDEATMTQHSDADKRDPAEEGTDALDSGALPGPPSPFTCPDCGGVLWELRDGEVVRFQCHVGHGFNGDSLVAAQSENLEAALWTALRALEESSALRRRMAIHARQRGMSAIAESYEEHAHESEVRADLVRRVLVGGPARDGVEVHATEN
jgi:two-component system chemotaxis response regulator CheB